MGYPKSLVQRIVDKKQMSQVGGGGHFVAGTQILLSGHLQHFLGHELAQQIPKLLVIINSNIDWQWSAW